MYFKYIILLTLAVASNGLLDISIISISSTQEECTDEEFQCANGKCTRSEWQCNGIQDCKDGSDELNCTSCTDGAFRCGDGECIYKGSVCDLYDDCEDGSDENNCAKHVCDSYEFQCQSGQCVHRAVRCDGKPHCADDSDEENCLECHGSSWGSLKNPYKCVSGDKCISHFKQCDSIKDCPDGSDEDQATCKSLQCAEGETQCGLGNCVRRNWFCEGIDPCSQDHDPEYFNFTCPECPFYDMFKCKTEEKCIEKHRLCDTEPDCEDGSDESRSTCSVHECGFGDFQCQSGQCLHNSGEDDHTVVCNGHNDCGDKSDEANCTTCSPDAIKCGSGECVHKLNLCNSKAECSDGSDENEINCPNGSIPPVLTTLWREGWPKNTPNVTFHHLTEDLAVYFDSSVSRFVTWPFWLLSQAWKYAKKTFKLETLSEPESQFLYVVLGKRKQDEKYNFSFWSQKSGYRNIIDAGLSERNGWVTQNTGNFEKLLSSLGYIVESAMKGVENNADEKLCDSSLRNIVFYDIFIHLKGRGSADVVQYKANQFNRTFGVGQYNCFRDWFLPVYEKYGGANVLNNYFHIFKRNWPKNREKDLNVGEFVHFWSGAAEEDLRYLAKSAFINWNDVFVRQFAKAQTDFLNITYSRKIISGNHWRTVNLNYMEKSSSHHLRSLEGQTVKTKAVLRSIQEKYFRGLN